MTPKPSLVNMATVQELVPAKKIVAASRPAAAVPARLRGEPLLPLFHVECLQRSSKVLRVTGEGRLGLVFFRRGEIVHATTGLRTGEEALRTILRWDRGTVDIWDSPWPKKESITVPWQNLLLRATQEIGTTRDQRGESGSRYLSFPANSNVAKGEDDLNKPTSRPEPPFYRLPIEVVKVDASGEVKEGASATELVERVAYAAQIADLLGELLGAGPFESVEVSQPAGACLIVREQGGGLAAAATRDASLDQAALRQRLNLPPERP
jgi:hypothetical protein